MLKILQTRLQQYVNCELPDVKLILEKAQEPEIKLPTSDGSLKKLEFQKNTYFCFIDYAKAFDCVDHNKLWKILKEIRIPDHLTWLLRNHDSEARSNSQNCTWNNELFPDLERSTSRLYIVPLLM